MNAREPPPANYPDLTGRPDIERLANTFYDKIRGDDLPGFIFKDVAGPTGPRICRKCMRFGKR